MQEGSVLQGDLAQRLDRNYRLQRHVYDLSRKYYLLGRDGLIAGLQPPDGGHVLEVGCGTARNLVLAQRRYPRAHFYGIDLSRMMLATARRKLKAAGLDKRIALAEADATSFEPADLFGIAQFDRIFFSYALSMIPPWEAALAHALRHLAPGGALHVVDFGTGTALPAPATRALRVWLAKFHVTPRDGLAAVLERLAAEHKARLVVTPRYRTYTIHAVLTLA